MFSLLKYAKKYKVQVILGPLFKFLEAVFELFLPIYMAKLVNNGIQRGDTSYTIQMGLRMVVMSVIGLVCVLICQYFASIASQGFGTALRKKILQKINTFSHQDLDRFGTATLVTRTTNDVNQLQLALAMLIRLVIRAPFLSVGSVVMAFYINRDIALIFAISLPLFCCILYFIMKKAIPLYTKVQLKIDQLNQLISENLSGVRVIRAFARQKKEESRVGTASNDLAKSYTWVGNISALLTPATTFILNISIITILWIGGVNVNTGNLQPGDVLALINYMMQMLLALIVVSNLVVIFTRASASAARVNELLNTTPTICEAETVSYEMLNLDSYTETLSYQQVSFRYSENSGLALSNITFSLKKGQTLGIIGPTGSGKTTLTQLIPRFYDPEKGIINVYNRKVKEAPLHQLRASIGIVPQKSVLFSGTIRENLCWGKSDATDQECWRALDIAQSTDFVTNLPLQLDTLVQAEGANFSGGQRQRLCIARAIIRKPKILILDDSLSALDYQTDLLLRNALKTKLKGTTLIIISQRISSVKDADQILVLNDGLQVGLGNHTSLIRSSTFYQEIYNSQQEGVTHDE